MLTIGAGAGSAAEDCPSCGVSCLLGPAEHDEGQAGENIGLQRVMQTPSRQMHSPVPCMHAKGTDRPTCPAMRWSRAAILSPRGDAQQGSSTTLLMTPAVFVENTHALPSSTKSTTPDAHPPNTDRVTAQGTQGPCLKLPLSNTVSVVQLISLRSRSKNACRAPRSRPIYLFGKLLLASLPLLTKPAGCEADRRR